MSAKFALCIASLLLVVSPVTLALPEDRNEPIYVSADSASLNDETGITTYRGKVVIKQGSLLIEGQHVEMYRSNDELKKLIAKGSPAHFRQKASQDSPYSDAWGDKLIYMFDSEKLTIEGNAKVIQNQDTFTGNRITYDINRSIVNAFGNGQATTGEQSGRVNMVIQPSGNKGAQSK